ncbi:DNA-directed RNA polymerase subunit beta' [Sinanaerobacter sp. ZZT-01]|uniref:DNA-directed RNA polymerase subunit beta' n=1 Tax=Sinanaerobacter sp. ZZT-01 TaxID=3111540 RepID=UPI002D77DC37|nr:DNA-directed RNA polymerase subunit beta' [Sinanaerobacter sp. ZZT-01]WRR92021.1 DNA-directed RNA polymerase subunit beta' [Sinanaerobacter sp. ZZT-01]
MYELNNFESLQISLASTEKIRSWSHGEVKKPETINYRTLKPEKEGLFCEKIFGPTKDWECHCGKYKRIRYKGIVCDRCGVEVTKAKVRRERMGHIELAAPVSHIWYFKGIPSRMGLVLDISPRNLEKVLYFAAYIVTDPADSGLGYKEILTEQQYREAKDKFGSGFKAAMGAEAVKELLSQIDLVALSDDLRNKLKDASGQKKIRIVRRLEVIEALRTSGNKPEWMILEVIPVIPPDLRPMVQLDGGRFATSDLNDLYRRVINRNNRLKRLLDLGAPDIIVRNEKRMLQEAVDALIDNGRRGRPVTGPGSRPLKSLSDMLKGKQGRFRQNLLGKRVDYSGRSVIVVGPELKFYQCGLPKKMALELFKPFIMKKLVQDGHAHNIKSAKRMVEKVRPEVWDVLDEVIKDHPVLLNRAPTLHRLGIQAFEPVLVEGKAIKLHPLVCTAYNADFDGDQMAVHVPLSVEAQAEARFLMLSVNNILAPKDGSPITTPTQDMILGSYYLTHPGLEERNTKAEIGDGSIFTDYDELLMAYQTGAVGIHARVKVRKKLSKEDSGKLVESTVGRFIFNDRIPQDLGYVDRIADPYSLEIDFLCDKKKLGQIIDKCYRRHGNTETVKMLDHIKSTGFRYSTKAAITISVADMEMPKEKKAIIEQAQAVVDKYQSAYRRGLMSNDERYEKVIQTWHKATDDVADALMDSLGTLNNLYIMAHSGARGSKNQIKQVGGMRGLMANATGKTIEIPITANFREGLSVMEYFLSSNGARKGLADTALRTADSGYLTRRLVDVSHNAIVREVDCGTTEGIEVRAFTDGKEVIEALKLRIVGRTAMEDIYDTKGSLLVAAGEEIKEAAAEAIEKAGIESVKIRSVMACKSQSGICAKCYGRNLATGEAVNIGEAVGITAAQSIGEPGTQLTMRTFHTGGVSVAGNDITQGLPRVEELFEARKPKGLAEICEADGKVISIESRKDNKTEVKICGEEEHVYIIPYGARLRVLEGDFIKAGDAITKGPLNPHDILRLNGVEGVYQYLLKEVQRVYKQQGVDINDKHVEVIVSQMLSKCKIEDAGDTALLPGGLYSQLELADANAALEEGQQPAVGKRVLLGITKASLATNSFLSAASFQETTRVLTDAAIKGKNDKLLGLKENVIIGKLIPAGTGMKRYRGINLDYGVNTEYMNSFKTNLDEDDEFDNVLEENAPFFKPEDEIVKTDAAVPAEVSPSDDNLDIGFTEV